jgi:Tol biopolymer transport system component
LNIVTGATRQLTFDPAADGLATISPDGLSVAFLSNRQGGLAVWWVGINGGNPQKMFDIPAEWGTLRSDGWSEEKLSWGG